MIGFEKCWSENSDAHRCIDSNHHEIAEYYWREALEWVLGNTTTNWANNKIIKKELELDK